MTNFLSILGIILLFVALGIQIFVGDWHIVGLTLWVYVVVDSWYQIRKEKGI